MTSAERERERLHAGVEELDLEPSIGDRSRLPDQLIQALFDSGAVAAVIDVATMRGTGRLPVDRDAEADTAPRTRPHDEVQVAGVKAIYDPAVRAAQDGGLAADRPVARPRPLIEREARRRLIAAAPIRLYA